MSHKFKSMAEDFRLTAGQVAVAMQTTENTSQILQKELESARAERQELQSRVSTLQEEKWACTQEDAAGEALSSIKLFVGCQMGILLCCAVSPILQNVFRMDGACSQIQERMLRACVRTALDTRDGRFLTCATCKAK